MASDRLAVVARACARGATRVTPALAAWDAKRLVHIEGRVAEVRHGFVECADVVDVVASRVRAWGVGGGGARIVARAAVLAIPPGRTRGNTVTARVPEASEPSLRDPNPSLRAASCTCARSADDNPAKVGASPALMPSPRRAARTSPTPRASPKKGSSR